MLDPWLKVAFGPRKCMYLIRSMVFFFTFAEFPIGSSGGFLYILHIMSILIDLFVLIDEYINLIVIVHN